MVFSWFVGDFFKSAYYIIYNVPIQLILTTAFQLVIDTLIVIQIKMYKEIKPTADQVRSLQTLGNIKEEIEGNIYDNIVNIK